MFEAYLAEQGYGEVPHEPDLGVGKFPDYVIERNGQTSVVEVKESSQSPVRFPLTISTSPRPRRRCSSPSEVNYARRLASSSRWNILDSRW